METKKTRDLKWLDYVHKYDNHSKPVLNMMGGGTYASI